jgi:hypothetical protein
MRVLGFGTGIREDRLAHCRSLHCAPPDFLWNLVASFAYAVLSGDAWQEIRVRSGRDDKGKSGGLREGLLVAERSRAACICKRPLIVGD